MEQSPLSSTITKFLISRDRRNGSWPNTFRRTASTICRWEGWQATPRRDHVERLDRTLKADGQLVRKWTAHTSGSSLPPWMLDAGRLEEAATSIEYISPILVPGLLQCQEYATLLFQEGRPFETQAEINRLVNARCGRYEQLQRLHDPSVTATFPVTALTLVPDAVRTAQATHLLTLLEGGRVRIHLLPEETLLLGITSPVLLVRLGEGGRAASSDHISGNVVLDRESNLERLDELVKRTVANALPAQQSATLLKELQ